MHLSNVHFVLRDISALLDLSWGSCLNSLSKEAIEKGGEEGMEGRRELRPKIW